MCADAGQAYCWMSCLDLAPGCGEEEQVLINLFLMLKSVKSEG